MPPTNRRPRRVRLIAVGVLAGGLTLGACSGEPPVPKDLPSADAGPLPTQAGYVREQIAPNAFPNYTAIATAAAPFVDSVEAVRVVKDGKMPPVALGLDFAAPAKSTSDPSVLTALATAAGGADPAFAPTKVTNATAAYSRTIGGTAQLVVVGPGDHLTLWVADRSGAGVNDLKTAAAAAPSANATAPTSTTKG